MAQGRGEVEAFGADRAWAALWIGLAGLKVPFVIFGIVRYGFRPDMLFTVITALSTPVLVLIFVSRFRVEYTAAEFRYRGWGAKVCVPYADIDRIEIPNRTLIERLFVRAFIVTRDGRCYSFWPKAFPKRAVARFLALGRIGGKADGYWNL
jgi:hypothetical protein